MTRDVRFPIASPGPNEPLVNPDGTAKDALREVIETVVNQAGGQGGDAVYDTQLLAILADQNAQQAKQLIGLAQEVQSARLEAADIAARFERELGSARAEMEALRAIAESRRVTKGSIVPGAVERPSAVDGFSGVVAVGSSASEDWYPGTGTPTKAVSDYDTITIDTDLFSFEAGDRLEVCIGYKNICIKNAFEHFSWDEQVSLRNSVGALVHEFSRYPLIMRTATNAVPASYTTAEDVVCRQSETFFVDVPDPLTGGWLNSQLKGRIRLAPDGAVSGSTDCITGGTFNATSIKDYFRVENIIITVRVRPKRLNIFVGS
jgi:hypothetical protein